MPNLFIYGTLMPGEPNEHILKDIPGTYRKASLVGELFKNGWQGGSKCPGLLLDESKQVVNGYVLSSDLLARNWRMLDEFEGPNYKRVVTKVWLKDQQEEEEAFVYVINSKGQPVKPL